MKTLVVGRASNLSRRLAATLPDVVLVSARDLMRADVDTIWPEGPFSLVLNHFQPATALNHFQPATALNHFQPATALQNLSDPQRYVDLSLTTTARLLAGLAGQDCRKVVYTSSAAVYGDDGRLPRGGVPRIATLHAGSKITNEYLVCDLCSVLGLDHTVVRLVNLYGGEDRFSIVARILEAVREQRPLLLANAGNAVRDFVHVDDVVRCYAALLEGTGLPIVNVAAGQGTSVRGIVDAIRLRGHVLATTDVRRTEIRFSTADVSRLSEIVDVSGFVGVVDQVLGELG